MGSMTSSKDSSSVVSDTQIEAIKERVGACVRGLREGRGLRIGVVCSLFNGGITWRLLEGALEALSKWEVDARDVTVVWVPGAFEIPLVARCLASDAKLDAIVCLGAVVRGETGHYDFVAGECASGIQRVQLETGVPVVFGVLTTETISQAEDRSGAGDANKGFEAATTGVEMATLVRQLHRLG